MDDREIRMLHIQPKHKMIKLENIQELVGNHVAPYIYNAKNFTPGKTPIYYSGP